VEAVREIVEAMASDAVDPAVTPTARERFEASARNLAESAEALERRRRDFCREAYDAVPFGLRRRIPAGILLRHGERREIHPASQDQAVARIQRACFELARRLWKEMIEIDAELSRLPQVREEGTRR
jgi:hypothetical protein